MEQSSQGVNHDLTRQKPPASIPSSQDSSSVESIPSQTAQMHRRSVEMLETSQDRRGFGPVTPSTPLSAFSSQENTADVGPRTDMDISYNGRMGPAQDLRVRTAVLSGAFGGETNGALKRTLNGDIKSPVGRATASLPASPAESYLRTHSRNTSTASRSSQIGELSNQLRTRLSYAMVKVQHGWERNNIDELERMDTDRMSPASATSTNVIGYDSRSPIRRPTSSHSTIGMLGATRGSPNRQSHKRNQSHPYKTNHPTSATSAPNSAHEPFWHGSPQHDSSQDPHSATTQPSLAPPADILPRTSAQARQSPFSPSGQQYGGLQPPQHPPHGLSPSTPKSAKPQRPHMLSKIRTPSQQAAVEKDAVETLLFMSSPGNSKRYAPASQSQPPSQATSTLSATRLPPHLAETRGGEVLIPRTPPPPTNESQHIFQAHPSNLLPLSAGLPDTGRTTANRGPWSSQEIDKILDEMSESEESDSQNGVLAGVVTARGDGTKAMMTVVESQ